MAKTVAQRVEGYRHEVRTPGGHVVEVDEPTDLGGTDEGPKPTQLLEAALASCTAITVEMYAERKGWDLGRFSVEVEAEYEGPRPVSFRVHLDLPDHLDADQVARLEVIASKCPVHRALINSTPVEDG